MTRQLTLKEIQGVQEMKDYFEYLQFRVNTSNKWGDVAKYLNKKIGEVAIHSLKDNEVLGSTRRADWFKTKFDEIMNVDDVIMDNKNKEVLKAFKTFFIISGLVGIGMTLLVVLGG